MRKNSGFTLIELLVIIAVLAILVAISLAALTSSRVSTRNNVRVEGVKQLRLTLEEYKVRCGEYPATLNPEANNGNCPEDFHLENLLQTPPEAPEYTVEPHYFAEYGTGNTFFESYLYSALSSNNGGRCYEYHIGVPLELGEDEEYSVNSSFLKKDHDCSYLDGRFQYHCEGSGEDFEAGEQDEEYGVYDFRSLNNCQF